MEFFASLDSDRGSRSLSDAKQWLPEAVECECYAKD